MNIRGVNLGIFWGRVHVHHNIQPATPLRPRPRLSPTPLRSMTNLDIGILPSHLTPLITEFSRSQKLDTHQLQVYRTAPVLWRHLFCCRCAGRCSRRRHRNASRYGPVTSRPVARVRLTLNPRVQTVRVQVVRVQVERELVMRVQVLQERSRPRGRIDLTTSRNRRKLKWSKSTRRAIKTKLTVGITVVYSLLAQLLKDTCGASDDK